MAKKGAKAAGTGVEVSSSSKAVKVNTANLGELKHACDDAVKAYFSRPTAFVQSHALEDIRLVLGWSSALVTFAAAYYGYVTPFDETKRIVGAGVVLNLLLTTLLAYHTTFVEKDTIFQGKRRTFSGRISTEKLTIASKASTGLPTRHTPATYLLSLVAPTTATSALPLPAFPSYSLSVGYVHSSNGGKALIHKAEMTSVQPMGSYFDTNGYFSQTAFDLELARLLAAVLG